MAQLFRARRATAAHPAYDTAFASPPAPVPAPAELAAHGRLAFIGAEVVRSVGAEGASPDRVAALAALCDYRPTPSPWRRTFRL